MSITIHTNDLTEKQKKEIDDNLLIELKPNRFAKFNFSSYMYPYLIQDDKVTLPFAYACQTMNLPRKNRGQCMLLDNRLDISLLPRQKPVKSEAIKLLNKHGSVIISCYCGWGKTMTSLYLANKLGMKTLIIAKGLVLLKQWVSSIKRVNPDITVQFVKPKSELNEDADFFVINAQNMPKMGQSFFENIGTCVVDEIHQVTAKTLSQCLHYISPRYLIGLSATPYRNDGLNSLIDFYFGERKIIRELNRPHTVYKISTGLVPEVERGENGVIWDSVLRYQAEHEERNQLIVDIVKKYKDKVFLILTKRISQGEYLYDKLAEEGIDVTALFGKHKEWDRESRVLIGIIQKCGTGFDHCKLNAMILATDTRDYFTQYLGRVLARSSDEPMVFDLVDDNNTLVRHYRARFKVYKKHGGKVKNIKDYRKFLEE